MIHRALKIGRWSIDFIFAKKRYDMDGIAEYLYNAGASARALAEVLCEMGCTHCH